MSTFKGWSEARDELLSRIVNIKHIREPQHLHRFCQISGHRDERGEVFRRPRLLCRLHLVDEWTPAREEEPALLAQRDVCTLSETDAEVLPEPWEGKIRSLSGGSH